MAIYVLIPLEWVVVNSTKSNGDIFSTFGFWFSSHPQFFENVASVFAQDGGIFSRWMLNSIGYAAIGALGATVTSYLGAYAFSVWRFKGRDVLFWIIIGAMMIPGTALAVPIFQLMGWLGLINSPLAVVLPTMVSPFGLYLLRTYLDASVPAEMIDAARVDGAGETRILTTMIPPVARTGLATVFLLMFVGAWNSYLIPLLVLTDPNLFPVTIGLNDWNRQSISPLAGGEILYPVIVTASLLAALPIMVLFVMMHRQLRSGLAMGAVR
ncbi:MAG: carbohydrate ABC transporter permease [Microbacterium sp.]|nr:carbohydrate ABC transporter permease [Microbacterium sp.]